MKIGKHINHLRKENNLSQDDLAERIYVSRQTISNWETGKSYPDVNSLLLISELFCISIDQLVKGDLEQMKQEINQTDLNNFASDSKIFTCLFALTLILPIPLIHYFGMIGFGIWIVIAIVNFLYALKVEKHKKQFNIQTYKEIIAFTEGKQLTQDEKNQELGKRPYQLVLLVFGFALLGGLISILMVVFIM